MQFMAVDQAARWGLLLACVCVLACAVPGLVSTESASELDSTAAVSESVILFRGATVMTAAGPSLENIEVLVRGGKIAEIGSGLSAPPQSRLIDASGRWLTPGLIDPHCHLGVYSLPHVRAHADGNEASDPFRPEVRAEDSFWPQDPAIERALVGGVTTIHVLPGSANLVGGQGVTLRLRPALSARAMRFPDAPASMKLACGENPKRSHGKGKGAPQTRMGEVAMLRQALEDARSYKKQASEDFGKAALAAVIRGEILVQNHCYRADEMLLRLDLFRQFDVTPRAFHHAVEAYKIGGELAEAGVGAVVWPDWWGIKMELLDAVPANAALLDTAGVRVALHSDFAWEIQYLNVAAAQALSAGLRAGLDVDRDRAIRWLTSNPAWILGIDDRVGTIEVGKDADLVLWSGDPFSVYTRADLVFIEGELVYDRSNAAREPLSDFELGIREVP